MTNNKYLVGPPLSDGCSFGWPTFGIYISSLLEEQIGSRLPQRLAHGWPNNIIVKFSGDPLQMPLACPTMGQCSSFEN